MKPPPFRYHDPGSLDEAVALLATLENAKLLAGGQSLMPMLNMRFVQPDHVIDLNRITGLAHIRESAARIEIGAMTRQRDLEFSDLIRCRCPLMREALLQVGHRQTRNRGTIGGSLCHLDPAAELPMVAAALEADIQVASRRGTRTLPMADFPAFYMTPAIEPDEIVTGLGFTPWPEGHGAAFVEFARRPGDFAVVGVAALLDLDGAGCIRRAAIALGGVGQGPVRWSRGEDLLQGEAATDDTLRAAAESCRGVAAMGDAQASADYRRHLAGVLAGRALRAARDRARRVP
ncbi:MAG: xanthine dehydrogenase family protein subunit M [Alphaproteobacteria bacterium]|nr:xanthine dehydrogenase family protein subunit M [Alphaproteobacteria bacterium]